MRRSWRSVARGQVRLPRALADGQAHRRCRLGSGHTPSRRASGVVGRLLRSRGSRRVRSRRSETTDRVRDRDARERSATLGLANSAAELHPAGTVVLCRTAHRLDTRHHGHPTWRQARTSRRGPAARCSAAIPAVLPPRDARGPARSPRDGLHPPDDLLARHRSRSGSRCRPSRSSDRSSTPSGAARRAIDEAVDRSNGRSISSASAGRR